MLWMSRNVYCEITTFVKSFVITPSFNSQHICCERPEEMIVYFCEVFNVFHSFSDPNIHKSDRHLFRLALLWYKWRSKPCVFGSESPWKRCPSNTSQKCTTSARLQKWKTRVLSRARQTPVVLQFAQLSSKKKAWLFEFLQFLNSWPPVQKQNLYLTVISSKACKRHTSNFFGQKHTETHRDNWPTLDDNWVLPRTVKVSTTKYSVRECIYFSTNYSVSRDILVQNIQQSGEIFQYKLFGQQEHSSTKYSVSRNIPVHNFQSVGY